MLAHKLSGLFGGAWVPLVISHAWTDGDCDPSHPTHAHIPLTAPRVLLRRTHPHQPTTGKTTATAPSTMPAQVVPAPTLALSGLQDGCIDTVIFDATMGGALERCVVGG